MAKSCFFEMLFDGLASLKVEFYVFKWEFMLFLHLKEVEEGPRSKFDFARKNCYFLWMNR